jgi:hypothetical protein
MMALYLHSLICPHTVELNLIKFRGNFASLIHMPAGNSNILKGLLFCKIAYKA